MLTSKKYEKDTIVSFKLVNGDEIVAKIIEETADKFLISKPTTVLPSAQGMALMQSLYTGETSNILSLDKQHVMLHTTSVKEIRDYYIQTTTGIQPVSQGGIIT